MKKLTIILAGLIGFTSVMPSYALEDSAAQLSTAEAIAAIWKMSGRDTRILYRLFFTRKSKNNDVETVINDEAAQCIGNVREALQKNRFKNTIVAQILKTFDTATPVEQEALKKAVSDSREEYIPGTNTVEAATFILLFPVSIATMLRQQREHDKKIEAKRAGIAVKDTTIT